MSGGSVPPSGHQNVDEHELEEALSLFLDPDLEEWVPGDQEGTVGGVNNVTRRISIVRRLAPSDEATPDRFCRRNAATVVILRIYRNNNDTNRVAFEHMVLEALADARVTKRFASFAFPQLLKSRRGRTYEILRSGACCCLFRWIPGSLANNANPEMVGYAAGVTSAALAEISPSIRNRLEPAAPSVSAPDDAGHGVSVCDLAPPYCEIWRVHHAVGSLKHFLDVVREHQASWFRGCSPEAADAFSVLVKKIAAIGDTTSAGLGNSTACGVGLGATSCNASLELGDQHVQHLVHGDLHYDNVLMMASSDDVPKEGADAPPPNATITGVLDFEFVTFDWRVMELAICLSKYLGEDDPMAYCRPFVQGYVAALRRVSSYDSFVSSADESHITAAPRLECPPPPAPFNAFERRQLPHCIALRILSNVVYFAGRTISGEDIPEGLTTRTVSYLRRLRWLELHGDELVRVLNVACTAP
jgi:homoserine kinase type II